MWLELARPVTLLASVLSLLVLTHTAFFGPEIEFQDRLYDTLCMFVIAAALAFLSGLTFREAPNQHPAHGLSYDRGQDPILGLYQTFPVRIFCWTTGILFVLFILAWYLHTHFIPYRDIHS